MTVTKKSDKQRWEPMRLEAVGSLGTVITSMTGSIDDNNPKMPGLTQA